MKLIATTASNLRSAELLIEAEIDQISGASGPDFDDFTYDFTWPDNDGYQDDLPNPSPTVDDVGFE